MAVGRKYRPPVNLDALKVVRLHQFERRLRAERERLAPRPDIVDWMQAHYYIPETTRPIALAPHQVAVLRLALPAGSGEFPYRTVVWSQPKKSGKTAISGGVVRWAAETWGPYQVVLCVGNDAEQAKERAFAAFSQSVELTPGYDRGHRVLPQRWRLLDAEGHNHNGSTVKAIATDYQGEAGANPSLTVFTELWGFIHTAALRFWAEMAPSPTRANSLRWVETYAGYEGESELLWGLYDAAVLRGRQLTAGELSERTGCPLGVFAEAPEPDDLVPIYVNDAASVLAYWDDGDKARRMEWQQGERGAAYYANEEATQTPGQFARLHRNQWVSAESAFVPIESWDACEGPALPLVAGDKTPLVVGLDAATTKDCFGLVVVSRDPDNPNEGVAVRMVRKWTPSPGHPIQFSAPGGPTEVIRWLAANFNVVQFAYDPAQVEQLAIDLTKERVGWFRKFPQGRDRLLADNALYDLIVHRRLRHDGNADLREHVANANAKTGLEDRQLRIVKRAESRKIDLLIALAMASHECLRLRI